MFTGLDLVGGIVLCRDMDTKKRRYKKIESFLNVGVEKNREDHLDIEDNKHGSTSEGGCE